MRIDELTNLTLPKKSDEEFLKINFESLFSYNFLQTKDYELDIRGLKTVDDTNNYQSILFDVVRNFDKKQKIITIDKSPKEPIFIIYKLDENETFYTNSIKIEVLEGVKASIVEVFETSCKNSAYCVNRNIVLEKNSSLEYAKIENIKESNSMIYNLKIEQKENSKLKSSNFEYGDGFVVNNYENIINEENCNYELNGLLKLDAQTTNTNLIKTIHNQPSSISSINYKNTLKDSSKAVVKIKSVVNETALFSKAFQNCNTILLSDDAVIFAQPHLEIYIDELQASHGTTTGTLNKEQLLYLQSRGISQTKAYEMLLEAFEKKIIENIDDELIKEFVINYKGKKDV